SSSQVSRNTLIGLVKPDLARWLQEAWQKKFLPNGFQVHPTRSSCHLGRHHGSAGARRGRGPAGDRAAAVSEIRIKQEAFALAQAFLGFVILALVLLGIGGTIYKIISPEGWVAQAFGRSLSAGAAALGSLIMVLARQLPPPAHAIRRRRDLWVRGGRAPLRRAALDPRQFLMR